MKAYRQLYSNPSLLRCLVFIFGFYGLMTLAKTVQVLWFNQQGALENFGLSYTAMAAAGALSFIYAPKIASFFPATPMLLPIAIYSSGISLRVYADSTFIAVISGLISGVGASSILNVVRVYLADHRESPNFDLLLSQKNLVHQMASSAGAAFVGPALIAASLLGNGHQVVLLFCSAGLLLLVKLWPGPTDSGAESSGVESLLNSWTQIFSMVSGAAGVLLIFSLYSGFCAGFAGPYLTLLLRNRGFSVGHVGLLVGIGMALGAAFQTIVTPMLRSQRRLINYTIFEIALSALTICLTVNGLPPAVAIGIYLSRVLVMSVSAYLEEAIEYAILPKRHQAQVLGGMQSAFLVGDMLGGGLSGFVASGIGVDNLYRISAILILGNGILFALSAYRHKAAGGPNSKMSFVT